MRVLVGPTLRVGDAHEASISIARSIPSRELAAVCCCTASLICSPQVKTGFRLVIGSWKIMLDLVAADVAHLFVGCLEEVVAVRGSPRRRSSRALDEAHHREARDALPQPDSPTTPSVWPWPISNVTPSTALTVPSCVKKWVLRPLISREADGPRGRGHRSSTRWRGSSASRMPSPRKLAARTIRMSTMLGKRRIRLAVEVLEGNVEERPEARLVGADAESEEAGQPRERPSRRRRGWPPR